MTDLKPISPLITQVALRNLGMYCSSYLANDLYFFMEAVHLLVADIGDVNLTKLFQESGKDWTVTKKRIEEIDKKIMAMKVFYDALEDKKFAHKDKENILKKYFVKTASKIALMQTEIYELFVFLVKSSTLQRMTIPQDAFKILEHIGFKKIELDKRRAPNQMPQQSPSPEVRIEQE